MFKLLFVVVAAVLVSCHDTDSSILNTSVRQGNLNRYFLYTRQNDREFYEITEKDTNSTLLNSPLNATLDTAIIIHGHQGSAFTTLNPVVKDAFLRGHDVNVIVVDWSVYAYLSYSNAVSSVPSVGVYIAEFISRLVTANAVELNRLHVVGFNLGAHVAGFAGRTLGGQIARITGLDPSRSQWGSNARRLALSDARYVEVIHTDGDGLLANGLGTAIGHVDIFPNGGNSQPGCLRVNSCNHNRAWQFFAATLIYDHLVASQCSSWLQLTTNLCRGYTVNMGNNNYVKYASGTFRVNTKRSFPF